MRKEFKPIIEAIAKKEHALSHTSSTHFAASPRSFVKYKLKEKERTDAMVFGNLNHTLLLEESKLNERVLVTDFDKGDSKILAFVEAMYTRYDCAENALEIKYEELAMQVIKEVELKYPLPRVLSEVEKPRPREFKAMLEEANGRDVVSKKTLNLAKDMRNAVKQDRAARKVLKQVNIFEKELDFEWLGYKWRGYMDAFGQVKFDYKTCPDAHWAKFNRKRKDEALYRQAAIYNKGAELQYDANPNAPYYLIAVDKNLGVSVHLIDAEYIEFGVTELTSIIDSFNRCLAGNLWHMNYGFHAIRKDGIFVAEKPSYLHYLQIP